MIDKDTFKFEFSPQLISLLGEQLIHDKKIALAELVKNAYDADASEVVVEYNNEKIIVKDDGVGMDSNIIKNIWLKPGYSDKKKQLENKQLTPRYKRVPLGEKGIGRLGAHKLGKIIKVCTKSKGNKEIHLTIKWKDLEDAQDLSEVPIDISETDNGRFNDSNTGTEIEISGLKEQWEDKDFKATANELSSLISPFVSNKNFNIIFQKDEELYKTDLNKKIEKVIDNALFNFEVVIKNGLLKKFVYEFKPWTGLEKIEGRKIDITDPDDKGDIKKILGKDSCLDLNYEKEEPPHYDIGEILF